jgi:hypothetical protein
MIKTGDVFRRPVRQGREAYICEQLVLRVSAGMTGHGVFEGVFQVVNVAAANRGGN